MNGLEQKICYGVTNFFFYEEYGALRCSFMLVVFGDRGDVYCSSHEVGGLFVSVNLDGPHPLLPNHHHSFSLNGASFPSHGLIYNGHLQRLSLPTCTSIEPVVDTTFEQDFGAFNY